MEFSHYIVVQRIDANAIMSSFENFNVRNIVQLVKLRAFHAKHVDGLELEFIFVFGKNNSIDFANVDY